ncbi:hypothetical protein LAZ67_5004276 [Cordylochernes scorpioides]|uniref:RNA-directed DNA polymerase n=1 Tax=Cordylochernes scorpioides TaxID=51811 RepID=A0ABY6KHW4_9ARAC|nr:hypothetical protein LAZ67_5004276 [Cordylochernes scorpioides]
MTRLISAQYYWQNMTQDIAKQTLLSVISVCLFHLWPSCVAFHHDCTVELTSSRQDCGRQGTSKQVDHCLYRKMEQGREEDPKEPMESDPDYESGENTTFPKLENTLGRTEEVPPSHEGATPPPAVSDVLGSLTRTLHQFSAVTGLSREVELPRYNGSYEAQRFFTNYDAQADRAQLQYTTRLRKPPNLLHAPLRVINTRAPITLVTKRDKSNAFVFTIIEIKSPSVVRINIPNVINSWPSENRVYKDRYPIPKLEDFNHILRKTRYYSKIDLFKAHYQIPINEEDREKTAVITPFGLFEFEVMSFELYGAPATFQRFINQVLWGLDFVFPYLDDILVASKSEEEHESHLRAVFPRLDQYGLRINQAKTVLNVNNVEFLGYWITPEGIRPTESKVQAIVDYKKPETVQDLRRILGMLNFYRRFLKNAAEDQAILNDFSKGSKKNDKRSIPWTEEAEQKFIKCKTELSKAAPLTFPDSECPLALFTDASDRAMGAVLQHFIDGAWKPIAFFSKKLSESQTKYSTYDRELLAIFSAIKHFKFLLEGRDFTIFTDQKPLIYAFQQNLEKASPSQVRQLQYISQFTTSIRHVSGKDNMVADTLSRISEIISVDYDIIAEKQKDDTELSNLRSQNKSLIFKEHRLPSGKNLWCDISTNRIRPYIPEEFRINVFTSIHGLSHPGIKITVREVTSRYIWFNINKDIRNWTKGCINCQKSKITRHTKTEYGEFGKPDERFGTVHIDLIGPLPPSEGKTYCLTLIDRFTNWMEVLPLEDIKADTIIKSFYKEWISRYGAPCHLITDRGMQFMSHKLKEFAKMCGIQLKHTTSYHPQSNGKIERFHRTLKTAISSHNYIRWTERLPSVLLGLRSSIYGSSDFSIAQMVFGKTIRLPGEFFQDSQQSIDRDDLIKTLQKDMSSLQPMKSRINRNPNVFIHKDLQSCSHVFIRKDRVKKPLEPAYEGPFKVLKRTVNFLQ